MFWYGLKRTVKLGAKSLWMHKLRSTLTALGIIFGVSSVIAMLAIGEGASQDALNRITQLGSSNIIIKTVKPPGDQAPDSQGTSMEEYGLTYSDAERIRYALPDADVIVPQRHFSQEIWYRNRKVSVDVVGTVPWYTEISPLKVLTGRFINGLDLHHLMTVCVIDKSIYEKLFLFDDPRHARIKIDGVYYSVVGVVSTSAVKIADQNGANGMQTDASSHGGGVTGKVFLPLTTVKQRFGEIEFQRAGRTMSIEKVELQQITVKMKDTGEVRQVEEMLAFRNILKDLMGRFHKKQDYQIEVPLQLLKIVKEQVRQRTIVLGSIAAISLLVGGIGIMNIMLATVSERTQEIGVRRALGAKRRDIIVQFLSETLLLTLTGGLVGIVLGMLIPTIVTHFGNMPTVITPFSVILSFGISALVGVTFGWYPAWRAAHMDPIESLRHD
jgi:putative ABC transport system permease protein